MNLRCLPSRWKSEALVFHKVEQIKTKIGGIFLEFFRDKMLP